MQTVEELVRLGIQIERDYDHQRKYNQLQLTKSTAFDQSLCAKKKKKTTLFNNSSPLRHPGAILESITYVNNVCTWIGLGTGLGTFKGTYRIASVLPSTDSH